MQYSPADPERPEEGIPGGGLSAGGRPEIPGGEEGRRSEGADDRGPGGEEGRRAGGADDRGPGRAAGRGTPTLAVVIPVYNEEKNLGGLLRDWQAVLDGIGADYTIFLIDDGSKDGSLRVLKEMQQENARLNIHTQPNAGHGPAILCGYRLAAAADWVFQIDSDHQLDTSAFADLWAHREKYDLLVAERTDKNATAGRRRISAVSHLIVQVLFGSAIRDVNCPYRLMRGCELRTALGKVPPDSFAPNVLLSAWFVLKKRRIFTGAVDIRQGIVLRQSRVSRHIFRGALKSFVQTILFRIRL
ncbi:MAG: glycosyltransferase family 2 protein [Bacteroidetes bacterium]|nr:glycosyltransferase family 2 protein [Bacteroidota bacterium]